MFCIFKIPFYPAKYQQRLISVNIFHVKLAVFCLYCQFKNINNGDWLLHSVNICGADVLQYPVLNRPRKEAYHQVMENKMLQETGGHVFIHSRHKLHRSELISVIGSKISPCLHSYLNHYSMISPSLLVLMIRFLAVCHDMKSLVKQEHLQFPLSCWQQLQSQQITVSLLYPGPRG